ncbi:MAG: carboxylesterase/lipase family protein [Terracidiphilus sp.]
MASSERSDKPMTQPFSAMPRRSVLKGLAVAAAGGVASALLTKPADALPAGVGYPRTASPVGDSISTSDHQPVVETESGKVRGYIRDGIVTFKGIPYGADTSGSNRFMPPQKPAPWTGVRSSMQYGWVCPQPPREGWKNDEEAWLFSWNDGVANEDCLRLNIWSQAVNDGKKRPVMVWLHGGGYTMGSGNELLSYDGENLARRGDVVIVSINHRLNVLGYLNLASFGHQYADSANAGMLDIVAALTWVRDNIANFGGDPGAVTIFGQSGGGGKVTALMAMPAAQGLFHRAIVQSGSILQGATQEASTRHAAALLKQLGLTPSNVDKLQSVPIDRLEQAAAAITRMGPPSSGVIDFLHTGSLLGWSPVVDGDTLPQNPFDPAAPAISAKVPLVVGNTLNEFVTAINHPEAMRMTEDELKKRIEGNWAGKSAKILEAFRTAYPGAKPFELWSIITASPVRAAALAQVRRKAVQQSAPAYCYWFTWQTPVLNGRPMAFHCSEIAFVFDNTQRCENMTGGGPAARALAARMSEAWIHFARTGNPNHHALPRWTPLTPENNATMIFDQNCSLKNNLDDELQDLIAGS